MPQRHLYTPAQNRGRPHRQMLNRAQRPQRRQLFLPATWTRALPDIIRSAALTAPTNLGTAARAGCATCSRATRRTSGPMGTGQPRVHAGPVRKLRPLPPRERTGCGRTDDALSGRTPPSPPWRWAALAQTGRWTYRVGDLKVHAGGLAATRSEFPTSTLASEERGGAGNGRGANADRNVPSLLRGNPRNRFDPSSAPRR